MQCLTQMLITWLRRLWTLHEFSSGNVLEVAICEDAYG